MRLPVFSGFKELDPAPQRFLIYVAVNVVSWQNILGPAMVLFARKIEMPEFYVGMLISFLPFTTMLLLVTMPLITRLGPKKVMLWAWFLRNVIVCVVFTMPFALASGFRWVAWAVLFTAVLGFCLMRALGAGGWLPWLFEIVPENRRAVYFSTETALTQVMNVLIMLVQAWLLLSGRDTSIARFLLIYAIGIAMGFLSLGLMWKIPGGDPVRRDGETHRETGGYWAAYRDRRYLWFMMAASLCLSSLVWLGASIVMYLRDVVRIHDSLTMAINALASMGVLLTIASWGRFTDHSGSGRAMFKSMLGHVCAVLIVLLWAPGGAWSTLGMALAIMLANIFSGAFNVAANRAMLNKVPEDQRVGYTAAWTVCTALAMGVTPILAGALIGRFGLLGYRLCFLISIATGITGALACLRVVGDSPARDRGFHPAAPFRTLARIAGITLGLHESNRRRD